MSISRVCWHGVDGCVADEVFDSCSSKNMFRFANGIIEFVVLLPGLSCRNPPLKPRGLGVFVCIQSRLECVCKKLVLCMPCVLDSCVTKMVDLMFSVRLMQ